MDRITAETCLKTLPANVCAMKLPERIIMTAPQLYQCIVRAKTKAEGGACLRQYISSGAVGGFSDIPKPVFDKLEGWFPL